MEVLFSSTCRARGQLVQWPSFHLRVRQLYTNLIFDSFQNLHQSLPVWFLSTKCKLSQFILFIIITKYFALSQSQKILSQN